MIKLLICISLIVSTALAQSTQPPVLDSHQRPITAGGFVATGPIVFQDISEKAGITHWTHRMGGSGKQFIHLH